MRVYARLHGRRMSHVVLELLWIHAPASMCADGQVEMPVCLWYTTLTVACSLAAAKASRKQAAIERSLARQKHQRYAIVKAIHADDVACTHIVIEPNPHSFEHKRIHMCKADVHIPDIHVHRHHHTRNANTCPQYKCNVSGSSFEILNDNHPAVCHWICWPMFPPALSVRVYAHQFYSDMLEGKKSNADTLDHPCMCSGLIRQRLTTIWSPIPSRLSSKTQKNHFLVSIFNIYLILCINLITYAAWIRRLFLNRKRTDSWKNKE